MHEFASLSEFGAPRLGGVGAALENGARLLESEPNRAAAQAREILSAVPDEPRAQFLLGAALRRTGQVQAALGVLEPLALAQPSAAQIHLERGLALIEAGRFEDALRATDQALALSPKLADAWLARADCLTLLGRAPEADGAYARAIAASTREPHLLEAGAALVDGRLAQAETMLRARLQTHPTDVAAMRMLGEVAARLGRHGDAEALLVRAVELAPSFSAARFNLALVLHRANKTAAALAQIERLCAEAPAHQGYRNLKAAILARLGEYHAAIDVYEQLLAEMPTFDRGWLSYGHALKTAGRSADAIAAYRRSIELAPHFGEAYWSLANMKTFRFEASELDAMKAMLARQDLAAEDRMHFHYALGKAQEDAAAYAASFEHYAAGAKLRREALSYDAEALGAATRRVRDVVTRDFLAARKDWGAAAPDPIFIVGLPRAGSTLIEQILSSHSQVEGTMELPELRMIAQSLGVEPKRYPEALLDLDAAAVKALGEAYVEQTRVYRKSARPFFIDKMPNNWEHVGLIKLILPNAKIVDARRHPMACCFSAFKQHFARGQRFSYDLVDLGRYYRDYVETLAHMDELAPGAVHRVFYEQMVADTETQVRALLTYCGLDFETGCLAFHKNDRPVRTASSEQVRQPIFADGVDQWRNYEPWLGPLAQALGPVLQGYPSGS